MLGRDALNHEEECSDHHEGGLCFIYLFYRDIHLSVLVALRVALFMFSKDLPVAFGINRYSVTPRQRNTSQKK